MKVQVSFQYESKTGHQRNIVVIVEPAKIEDSILDAFLSPDYKALKGKKGSESDVTQITNVIVTVMEP
jgi:hypothetical protein